MEEGQHLTKRERRELARQARRQEEDRRKKIQQGRRIFLWFGTAVIVAGVLFGIFKSISSSSSGQTLLSVTALSEKDWFKGGKEAKVILVEYSDFQCPACGGYYPIVKQLSEEFGDSILFIYRHFSLLQHQHARLAAQAAEAAGKQGKFWQMHDLIFDNQQEWAKKRNAKEDFLSFSQQLDLNVERFKTDLDTKEIKDKIETDLQSGKQVGVNATPTFFLNGRKLVNVRSYQELKSAIDLALPSP